MEEALKKLQDRLSYVEAQLEKNSNWISNHDSTVLCSRCQSIVEVGGGDMSPVPIITSVRGSPQKLNSSYENRKGGSLDKTTTLSPLDRGHGSLEVATNGQNPIRVSPSQIQIQYKYKSSTESIEGSDWDEALDMSTTTSTSSARVMGLERTSKNSRKSIPTYLTCEDKFDHILNPKSDAKLSKDAQHYLDQAEYQNCRVVLQNVLKSPEGKEYLSRTANGSPPGAMPLPSTSSSPPLAPPSPSPSLKYLDVVPSDLERLGEGQWLNDSLVNFRLEQIYEGLSPSQKASTYIYTSFFYTSYNSPYLKTPNGSRSQLAQSRHAKIASWTKRVDIFQKKFLLFPIADRDHWVLAVVCHPGADAPPPDAPPDTPRPVLMILDSYADQPRNEINRNIRDYLTHEYKAKHGVDRVFDRYLLRGVNPKLPQQTNDNDCGLFLLEFARLFFQDPFVNWKNARLEKVHWFDRNSVGNLRRRMYEELKELLIQQDPSCAKDIPKVKFPDEYTPAEPAIVEVKIEKGTLSTPKNAPEAMKVAQTPKSRRKYVKSEVMIENEVLEDLKETPETVRVPQTPKSQRKYIKNDAKIENGASEALEAPETVKTPEKVPGTAKTPPGTPKSPKGTKRKSHVPPEEDAEDRKRLKSPFLMVNEEIKEDEDLMDLPL